MFVDRVRLGSLWLVGAISGFVVIEPAPYEFMVVLAAIAFAATGLTIRTGHLALMFMLIFYNIGFATSLVPVIELADTAKWTAVPCFLSLPPLFFAVRPTDDTARRADYSVTSAYTRQDTKETFKLRRESDATLDRALGS